MKRVRDERPNIIFIHAHDLGRYLGCYGRPVETPNLDSLAARGVRFDNCFCPAPQCSPSRASLITGLYPNRSGMMGLAHLDWHLFEPGNALPHLLAGAGYRTALFGEQHEASHGELLGYQSVVGNEWPQLARVVAPAFAEALPGLSGTQPFFASIGFFEAHRPFDHPGYRDDPPESIVVPPYLPDSEEVRADLAAFQGRVRAVDDGVGVVLDALDSAGLLDQSLLIFTTDHGIAFPRAKGTLYDPGLEVSLIVSWPGQVPEGKVRHQLLCNVDLAATLLDVARVAPREVLDGQSFLPLLLGEEQVVRERFMCQLTWHDRFVPMRGLRTERWKYIRHFSSEQELYLPADVEESSSGRAFRAGSLSGPPPREELYDLEEDPHELNDLAARNDSSALLAAFRAEVKAWMVETADPLLAGGE